MVDMDVSRSEIWGLRRYELAAWTTFVFLLGATPLLTHRSWSWSWSATADVRVQPLTAPPLVGQTQAQQIGPGGSWRLDINTAGEAELELLPGIGAGRARAIVRERERRGTFHSVWELTEVPGITKALVQRLEPLLKAGPAHP